MSRLARTRLLAALLLGLGSVVVGAAPAHAADPVDLFVYASATPDPVWAGGTLDYTVTFGNRGPGAATGTQITAPLPAGVSFVASSDDRCTATATRVTCDLGTVGAPSTGVLTLTVRPTEAGPLSVTFTVAASEPDTDPSDNSTTAATAVDTPTDADLAFRLSPPTTPVHAGTTFFVGVEVTNAGPATATNVTTTLRLSAGLALAGDAACVPEGAGSVCIIGGPTSLPPSTGAAGPIEVTATAPGDWAISGSVSADQPDPRPTNNTASGMVTALPAADLAAAIAESADPAPPGRPLTWALTVTNHGPSPATARLVHEWTTSVSGGLTLLSVAPSQGTCGAPATGRVECDLGAVASGATATVTVTLRPHGPGTATGRAQVTGSEYDPDPTDNLAEETTTVR